MIKQLLNLVIAKYHDLSVSHRSIIIDLLATDKSRYVTQPHPIILLNILHVHGPISRGT